MKKITLLHIFSAPQSAYFFMDKQLQFMIDKGIDIHVIVPNDGLYYQKLLKREKNVTFYDVPLKREISLRHDLLSLFKLISIIRKVKPNILHLHTPKASLLGTVAGRLCMIKNIIYQMHGLVSGGEHKKGVIYYMEKLTCKLSTKVYAVSNSLMEYAINNNYVSRNKISVIGNGTINGIDTINKFNLELVDKKKYNIEDQIDKESFVVGFVGRINEDKGIIDFIAVIKKMILNQINVTAIILGPNEMGKEFEYIINQNSIIKNNLLIFEGIEDPENVMYAFDVLLLPTKREGFGLVAAEVNALEIPVVSYNIPGIRDAIANNETGKLVEYRDIDKLVESVLDYYRNPNIKKEHGINGRKRVIQLFSQEYLWNEILNTYKNLLKDRN